MGRTASKVSPLARDFVTASKDGYLTQLYERLPCPFGECQSSTGRAVPVVIGATTTNVDFALTRGSGISGTVRSQADNTAIAGASVVVYDSTGRERLRGRASLDGTYLLQGLPSGSYLVAFSNAGWESVVYPSVACDHGQCQPTQGAPVVLRDDETAMGIDGTLPRLGRISGIVRFEDTGLPARNVYVYAWSDGAVVASGSSQGLGGEFSISGLYPGTYYLSTASGGQNYVDVAYPDTPCIFHQCAQPAGSAVTVTMNGLNEVTIRLRTGAQVSGTVTSALSGAGVLAQVTIFDSRGMPITIPGTWFNGGWTGGGGRYEISGLPAGTYFLEAAAAGYNTQLYRGMQCGLGCSAAGGTPVTLTKAEVRANIDFSLSAGAQVRGIAGYVRAASSNEALAGAAVNLYSASGSFVQSTLTNASGGYQFLSLSEGVYYLWVGNLYLYQSQVFSDIPCDVEPCPVTTGSPLVVGGGVTAVDVALRLRGPSIRGTVRAAGTQSAVRNAVVSVYSADGAHRASAGVNQLGQFFVPGLSPGSYFVAVVPERPYVEALWGRGLCVGCSPTSGTAVEFAAESVDLTFDVETGGAIEGQVVDADSRSRLTSAEVRIYDEQGRLVATIATTTGVYTSPMLLPGHYYVTASAPGRAGRAYPTVPCTLTSCDLGEATLVGVSRASVTDGIDFRLTTVTGFRRYFAEGSASWLFDCVFDLANPSGADPANVAMRFLRADGATFLETLVIPPASHRAVSAKSVPGLTPAGGFSTVIDSDVEVVAERTMTWSPAAQYGSHAETAVKDPAMTWYLAEGATHSNFQLYYLVQNPNPDPIDVQVKYLLPAPNAPVERSYQNIPANSRTTILVNAEPGVSWTDVSGVVTSLTPDHPIIVERAMYLDNQGTQFNAGTDSAGVTAPATDWFLAEGATLGLFDMYVLLANPGTADGTATLTYMLTDGRTLTKSYPLAAQSRQTVWVNGEEGEGIPLANVSLSTIVHADVPIIVERAMWWPMGGYGPGWREGHNSVGATETGTAWVVAAGEQGGVTNADTYVLVANTSPFAGRVRVTVLAEDGNNPSREIDIPANSRTTVWTGGTAAAPGSPFGGLLADMRFGVLVESLTTADGTAQTVVERATYSDAGGIHWAAGNGVVATKIR